MLLLGFHWLDVAAILWLCLCWLGYTIFSRLKARTTYCISSVLHNYRKQWMACMLQRDNRIADASLLANLERNASFLASTAIFIIAGLVTALASVDQIHHVLMAMPFSQLNSTPLQLQFKIGLLLLIFIYSFFTFTWAMRQYGFCAVLLGAAPLQGCADSLNQHGEDYAKYTAKVIDQAGHSYNYGLRSYYFSLAVLSWLLSPGLFIVCVTAVVAVLYEREFHSRTLKAMLKVSDLELDCMNKNNRKPKK